MSGSELKWPYPGFLPGPLRWLLLFTLTAGVTACLEFSHIPAALLIGPMISAILLAAGSIGIKIPSPLFIMPQGVIGCMVAGVITTDILAEMTAEWPIFLGGVVCVILAATCIGYILARWQILPGTTAIWGSAAGAASAMVLMAEAYGADERLVAIMQYMRVVLVAIIGSALAHFLAPSHIPVIAGSFFPAVDYGQMAVTLFIACGGALGSRYLRIPAGGMLVPFILGVILQETGLVTLVLPPWLLAMSYIVIGWGIGLRFTRPILIHALAVMPILLLSTLSLMAICGLFAIALSQLTRVDLLTAYLATSPGGADSVSIIAASTPVDVPFVMAYQTVRFLVVALTGPMIASFVARHITIRKSLPERPQTD